MKIVILGLGNVLLGDEGVGVHAIRELSKLQYSRDVEIVDVGTAILEALPALEGADYIIIIDAMAGDRLPGTVYKIPFEQCRGNQVIASVHGFDIFRTMSLAGFDAHPEIMVFGVEPEFVGWSLELSDVVAQSIPHLIDAVTEEIYGAYSRAFSQKERLVSS